MQHVTYAEKIKAERALNLGTLPPMASAVAAVFADQLLAQTKDACDVADELRAWKDAAASARRSVNWAEDGVRDLRAVLAHVRDALSSGQRINRAALSSRVDGAIDALDSIAGNLDDASTDLVP